MSDYFKKMREQNIKDAMLCGKTREEAEKFVELLEHPITSKTESMPEVIFCETSNSKEYEIHRENALKQIKGFSKDERVKKVQKLMSEGKTENEALQEIDCLFCSKIKDVLWNIAKNDMVTSAKQYIPRISDGVMSINVPPPNKDTVTYWKLFLKGYSKKDAQKMVNAGLDDIT